MHVRCQKFIILAIIYSSYSVIAKESDNCDCDVLQVNDPDGPIGYQNFTKQNGTLDGKPYYFSTQQNMISWNNHWFYEVYNPNLVVFESKQLFLTKAEVFSFENTMCEDGDTFYYERSIKSQCLKDNSYCFATRELTPVIRRNFGKGIHRKQVKLQATNPCRFPFIYNNVTYKSCTKIDHDEFWCATTVNAKNHVTSWGYCNNLCPQEENKLKVKEIEDKVVDQVADKSWHIGLVVGILVGILFIIALFIGYRCIMKKKVVAVESVKVTDEAAPLKDQATPRYSLNPELNGNQAMINSDMILNEQAGELPYSGEHEIERSKFEIGKKLGGGSFGSVYEGTTEDPIQPGQEIKVAIKTVNNPRDESQVYALMCEIKVLEKLEKHLNLVNMIGACTSGHNNGRLWLLLEHCPCGDMKNFLHKNRDVFMQDLHNQVPHKTLNKRLFIKWGYGIAKGMEYLSSKKIMHGDLAARNILISNSDHNYLAKITDFGLSKAFYDKTSYLKEDRRNVPWKWMDVDFLETSIFTMSSDVWSFGVVFWEMLSVGRTPYPGANPNDTIKEIKAGCRLKQPHEISQFQCLVEFYKEVTKMCWNSNPKQRSSFSNLVQTFETYLTSGKLENLDQNSIK